MDEQSGAQSSEFPTLTEATYGQALQRARELAGMSQSKLAELAGLQRTTIRNIERDITRAAPDTRLRLAKVLRIDFAAGPAPVEPWSPHQHFAPSYAPLQLASEMTAALNAPGGSLDQVFLYLDPQSAVDWMEYSNDAAYVRNFRDRMPLEAAAAIVVRQIGAVGLDVVALGAGDGKSETRLTQHLVDLLPQPLHDPGDERCETLDGRRWRPGPLAPSPSGARCSYCADSDPHLSSWADLTNLHKSAS